MTRTRSRKARARFKLLKQIVVGLFVLVFIVGIAGMTLFAGR